MISESLLQRMSSVNGAHVTPGDVVLMWWTFFTCPKSQPGSSGDKVAHSTLLNASLGEHTLLVIEQEGNTSMKG